MIKEVKATSNDTNGYTTEEYKVLLCSNMNGNNNKFYCIELQKKDDQYRLYTNYGRINSNNTHGIREYGSDLQLAQKEYEQIIKKKTKGKTKDGYIERYVEVETYAPSVGSPNIQQSNGQASVKVSSTEAIKSEFETSDPAIKELVALLCEENIHNITSTLDVTFTQNGFETPLGIITLNQIDKATVPLNKLQGLFSRHRNIYPSKTLKEWNTEFYSLIPHKFGRRITDDDLIMDNTRLLEKFDLLDNLKTAIDVIQTTAPTDTQPAKRNLDVEFEILTDKAEIKRIKNYVKTSRAPNHRNTNIYNLKVKTIYKMKRNGEPEQFETVSKKLGNIKELFHGSKNCNILSILKNGLKIFRDHPTKAGDMFGNGLYFADNSTKSANYCTNFWSSSIRNKSDKYFMFLADVAMGREYVVHRASRQPDKSFNSLVALKGQSLYNNEYVIYDEKQACIKYLIEFEL